MINRHRIRNNLQEIRFWWYSFGVGSRSDDCRTSAIKVNVAAAGFSIPTTKSSSTAVVVFVYNDAAAVAVSGPASSFCFFPGIRFLQVNRVRHTCQLTRATYRLSNSSDFGYQIIVLSWQASELLRHLHLIRTPSSTDFCICWHIFFSCDPDTASRSTWLMISMCFKWFSMRVVNSVMWVRTRTNFNENVNWQLL